MHFQKADWDPLKVRKSATLSGTKSKSQISTLDPPIWPAKIHTRVRQRQPTMKKATVPKLKRLSTQTNRRICAEATFRSARAALPTSKLRSHRVGSALLAQSRCKRPGLALTSDLRTTCGRAIGATPLPAKPGTTRAS